MCGVRLCADFTLVRTIFQLGFTSHLRQGINYLQVSMVAQVCPTEIIAFSDRMEEFLDLNTQLIAASTDTEEVHAWRHTVVGSRLASSMFRASPKTNPNEENDDWSPVFCVF